MSDEFFRRVEKLDSDDTEKKITLICRYIKAFTCKKVYVGITNDLKKRLKEHEDNNTGDVTQVKSAVCRSHEAAKVVEKYFIDKKNKNQKVEGKEIEGDTGGGSPKTNIVYVFPI